MRRRYFFIPLISLMLQAKDPWTKTDTYLEVFSEAGIITEWLQTQEVTKNSRMVYHPETKSYRYTQSINGIDAKIFGARPEMRNVNMYFLGWVIAHPFISHALPTTYRHIWQGGTIAFELIATTKNAQIGVRVNF